MEQKEIKEQCKIQYDKIKSAEQALKQLRIICSHETVFEGIWSYRIGSASPAIICSDCGKLIKYITETS